jgi:hypothetical protein
MNTVKEIRERAEKERAIHEQLAPTGESWDFRPLVKYWDVKEVLFLLAELKEEENQHDLASQERLKWKQRAEEAEATLRGIEKIVSPLHNGSVVETVDRLDQQCNRLKKKLRERD